MLGFSQLLKPLKWQDLLEKGKKAAMHFEQVQRFILEKKIQRFVRKFKRVKNIHDMQFWVFSFSKTEDMRSKVRQKKVGENGCCRNCFINKSSCNTFPLI